MKKLFLLFNITLCLSMNASQDITAMNTLLTRIYPYKENEKENIIIGKSIPYSKIKKATKAALLLEEKNRDVKRRAHRDSKIERVISPESLAYRP